MVLTYDADKDLILLLPKDAIPEEMTTERFSEWFSEAKKRMTFIVTNNDKVLRNDLETARIIINEIKNLLEKQKESLHIPETCKENPDSFTDEQKQIVLSDDFERALEQFLMNTDSSDKSYAEDVKIYADKLREIVQKEQKPAEWSEEDEGTLIYIMDCLNSGYSLDSESLTWIKKHLASLRPQPHWKPSKEQMKCLRRAINTYESDWGREKALILIDLYNDLKKF